LGKDWVSNLDTPGDFFRKARCIVWTKIAQHSKFFEIGHCYGQKGGGGKHNLDKNLHKIELGVKNLDRTEEKSSRHNPPAGYSLCPNKPGSF